MRSCTGLLSSCSVHTLVPREHTSHVGSLQPFLRNGFDFVKAALIVLPDLSTTFTSSPAFLNDFLHLHASARIPCGVASTKKTHSVNMVSKQTDIDRKIE